MDYCENSIYENIGDIQNEINNYKEFKKELIIKKKKWINKVKIKYTESQNITFLFYLKI